jgi:predicted RND superfamily exporter protein
MAGDAFTAIPRCSEEEGRIESWPGQRLLSHREGDTNTTGQEQRAVPSAPFSAERWMRRLFGWVTAHPVAVLSGAALVALLLGIQALFLTRETSPDAFIPPGHPALALKREVQEFFSLKEIIAVGVIRDAPGGVFHPATLRRIDRLSRQIQQLPGIEPGRVISLATESGVYFEDGEPGFELLMPEVPSDAAGLEALRRDILGYELYRGTLVAEDGSAATILVRLPDDREADRTYRALRDLVAAFPVDDERLLVAGEAAVRTHMGRAVSDDALRMNFICPVVMALLIVLAYRTLRGTVLPLAVIGGSSLLALGSMALGGVPVYIVTNGIFVIIMALGVADSLHLLGQYYEEQADARGRSRRQIVVDACMALWYPLLITSLTDIAGFTALYVGGIMPPIRYFGLFTSLGVLGALLYSYTVVPAGLALLPLRPSRVFLLRPGSGPQADALGRALGRLGAFVVRRRGWVLAAGAVVALAGAWGASRLIVNDARLLAFRDDHPIVEATRVLNQRFHGTNELNIVLTASEEGAFLQPGLLRRVEELEAFTESLPRVGGTHSLAGWVKRAHQKMNQEDPEFYAIPEDAFATEFYLDTLLAPGSPMAELLREVVDGTYTRSNLIVRMTSSEYVDEREVVERLGAYLEEHFAGPGLEATVAGRVHLDYHWLRLVRASHVRSVLFSSTCVLLLTGLMFRSAMAGLLCTMTIGMAVLVNYALMGLAGIPLGVGTSMFASIAIGAGVNFPVHLLDRLRAELAGRREAMAEVFGRAFTYTGRALFFTAFVVAIGFALLLVSEFQTLVRFGLLIASAILVSFATSVTVLPALVAVLRPRFLWGEPSASPPAD